MTDLQPETVQIGPVGLDIPLYVPEAGDWRGETGTLTGAFAGDDKDAAIALRSQFLGLASLQGQLVVCRFADRPELDGWYTLEDTSHGTDGASFAHGMFDYSVRVTRARAWQQLAQQERLLGAVRSQPDSTANDHGIDGDDITPWHSPGVAPLGYHLDEGESGATTKLTLAGADGPVVVVKNPSMLNDTARWQVAPSDFYRGSCRVLHSIEGRSFRVVGNQVPNVPNDWAMTNSLVTVRPDNGKLRIGWWDGVTWVSWATVSLSRVSGADPIDPTFTAVRVVRESPERSSVRVLLDHPDIDVTTLDIGIRRGSRFVDCVLTGLAADRWGVIVTDDAGGEMDYTSHTGGFHSLAANADGVKWIVNGPREWSVSDPAPILLLPARSFAFGIGAELGDPPDGYFVENFTDATWRWYTAMVSHQRPVMA